MASSQEPARWLRLAVVLCVSMQLLFSGFSRANAATQNPLPPPSDKPPAPADQKPAGPPTPGAPGQPPQAEKPFADLIKEAKPIEGLFTLYKKDETTYLELAPSQLDQPFLLSATLDTGIGERGFYGARVLGNFVFTFRRAGKNIQLVRKNVRYRAADNTPINRAVARSFSDSIIGSAKIESQPHPEKKSILIDLSNFMLADIPLLGYALEATYRLPYRLDRPNSAVASVKSFPQNTEVETVLNFAIERPLVPPPVPSPIPTPAPPLAPPDLRSIQLRLRYSLSQLPQTANFRPRVADDRVGHFLAMFQDYSDDRKDTPYVRYITRWNIEKADPSAPLSAPKEPIVFWLENTVPDKYRAAITQGVLMWNKAFERIGIKDAIVVKQQPDDADWDPADVRYNTIRWFIATDSAFAIGPSRANPFTGQIYDADIGFSESMTRFEGQTFDNFVAPLGTQADGLSELPLMGDPQQQMMMCNFAIGAMHQAGFGYNLLDARGTLADESARERYLNEYLIAVTAHEVGHTLGLRHNYRASTLHENEKLQDPALTSEWGLTGSVMDYTPVNLAAPGEKQGSYWQTSLGPYDYWAIEYSYKPIKDAIPEAEAAELKSIASRVADPRLAYGTDEDAFGFSPVGIDPTINIWDLGSDPLKHAEGRAKLVRELWKNLETKAARPGEGYQRMRNGFNRGFSELFLAMMNTSKFIGGVYHNRDHVGDPNGRLPYVPVPAQKQRQALSILNKYAFASNAFEVSPSLLNKLAMDRFWNFEGSIFNTQRLDYPIHAQVIALQRQILDRLYNPIVLARMQDLEVKYQNPREAFTMADMFEEVQAAIWTELKGNSTNINSFRRALQRDHLKRLTGLVMRPNASVPEDAATLARYNLTQLNSHIKAALSARGARMDLATRAHLQETAARIDETLKAQQQRSVN